MRKDFNLNTDNLLEIKKYPERKTISVREAASSIYVRGAAVAPQAVKKNRPGCGPGHAGHQLLFLTPFRDSVKDLRKDKSPVDRLIEPSYTLQYPSVLKAASNLIQ
jgi:hypothetical protein